MKFKCIVIGLLIAILTTCIFTSHKLIKETEFQTEAIIAQLDLSRYATENYSVLTNEPIVKIDEIVRTYKGEKIP